MAGDANGVPPGRLPLRAAGQAQGASLACRAPTVGYWTAICGFSVTRMMRLVLLW